MVYGALAICNHETLLASRTLPRDCVKVAQHVLMKSRMCVCVCAYVRPPMLAGALHRSTAVISAQSVQMLQSRQFVAFHVKCCCAQQRCQCRCSCRDCCNCDRLDRCYCCKSATLRLLRLLRLLSLLRLCEWSRDARIRL